MKRFILWLILASLACQLSTVSPATFPTTYPAESFPTLIAMTSAAVAIPTAKVIPTQTSAMAPRTPTLTPSPTLVPYEEFSIDFLRKRTYGGGKIEVVETIEDASSFTRYIIHYPSDGLNMYGFANVPKGEGPFPVIIAIHGYVNPANYQTLDYTTDALDQITRAGYIVLHPNLRGYPPSDNGGNLFRVGMAIDVLNLIALVKSGSGPSELFATAASDHIGLWAHSMGGDVVLRVLVVSPDIKATVLYSSISGDEMKNAELLSKIAPDPSLQTELITAPALLKRISPMYYYNQITSAIQLYHGSADTTVPIEWAQETCNTAKAAGVTINCIYYPDEDHTFRSRAANEFYDSMFDFYKIYLSP